MLGLPRAVSPAFKDAALKVSDGVPGLHAVIRGLFAAREPAAVLRLNSSPPLA
jgi:hypothetical protein